MWQFFDEEQFSATRNDYFSTGNNSVRRGTIIFRRGTIQCDEERLFFDGDQFSATRNDYFSTRNNYSTTKNDFIIVNEQDDHDSANKTRCLIPATFADEMF